MSQLDPSAAPSAIRAASGTPSTAVLADRYDAILLDLRMPVVDGLAFLRHFRRKQGHHDTPVAIVTGDYWLDETVDRALRDLGATIHFKPLWLKDMVRLARQLVPG